MYIRTRLDNQHITLLLTGTDETEPYQTEPKSLSAHSLYTKWGGKDCGQYWEQIKPFAEGHGYLNKNNQPIVEGHGS